MIRQRNLFQLEEQEKPPGKTTKQFTKEFKALIIRMLTKLRKIIYEHSENVNKELENIKKNQSELKKIQ